MNPPPQWNPEPLRAALDLGKLWEQGMGDRALEAAGRLARDPAEDGSGVGRVRDAFELDAGGTLALGWCLRRASELRPFPRPRELAALCGGDGSREEPLPLLFQPEAGCLLRAACDLCFGREPRLPRHLRLFLPGSMDAGEPGGEENFHGEDFLREGEAFLAACARGEAPLPAVLALAGGPGTGKKFLLARVCARRGCGMLAADCAGLAPEGIPELAGLALLFGSLVCLDGYGAAHEDKARELFRWFSALLCASREGMTAPGGCAALLDREVPPLDYAARRRAMEVLFPGLSREELDREAGLCTAPVGALRRASARLAGEAAAGNPPTARALREALRRESGTALAQSAQLLSGGRTLEDLILPPEQKRQLQNICAFARVRETVWKTWGFGKKLPGGQGITALFYGASGTGKTMAAGVVANELGLPLYRVDLSRLISKYIGETQKNIGKIFDEAAGADCILFFDEADALFSRRTDAADAQDRYANAEIAYLLQRTEQYDGIILLATNLLQNFDEAFRRRIGFMVRFPQPDEEERALLWRGIFPPEAPVEGLDHRLLAKQLELTGAGIRACALGAARLAAARGGGINMDRVAQAAREEYQKLGKPFPAALGQRYPQERS